MSLKIENLVESEHNMSHLNDLVSMIWARKDTVLLVIGGNPCIRSVYFKAIKFNKLSQFSHCKLNKIDYTFGKAEEKIKNKLLELVKLRKNYKIFVYISCMEIVTSIDIENIIDIIKSENKNAKIFQVKRGPMVKRYYSAKNYINEIFEKLDDEVKVDEYYEKPVFAEETEILLASLEYTRHKKCMIQPGGCISCIKSANYNINRNNLYFTRFDDLDITFGLEKNIIKECNKNFVSGDKIIFFETLLPQVIGFDNNQLEEYLDSKKIDVLTLFSEDFSEKIKVLEKAYEFILKDYFKEDSKESNKSLVCGYSTLTEEYKKIILDELEINKENYIFDLKKDRPKELVVLNLEGLIFANVWNKIKPINYKIIYPEKINVDFLKIYDRNIDKILLIGDPIQIVSYAKNIRKCNSDIEIMLFFCHLNMNVTDEIEKYLNENNIVNCEKIDELLTYINEKTLLMCDRQIYIYLRSKMKNDINFIELKYRWL